MSHTCISTKGRHSHNYLNKKSSKSFLFSLSFSFSLARVCLLQSLLTIPLIFYRRLTHLLICNVTVGCQRARGSDAICDYCFRSVARHCDEFKWMFALLIIFIAFKYFELIHFFNHFFRMFCHPFWIRSICSDFAPYLHSKEFLCSLSYKVISLGNSVIVKLLR